MYICNDTYSCHQNEITTEQLLFWFLHHYRTDIINNHIIAIIIIIIIIIILLLRFGLISFRRRGSNLHILTRSSLLILKRITSSKGGLALLLLLFLLFLLSFHFSLLSILILTSFDREVHAIKNEGIASYKFGSFQFVEVSFWWLVSFCCCQQLGNNIIRVVNEVWKDSKVNGKKKERKREWNWECRIERERYPKFVHDPEAALLATSSFVIPNLSPSNILQITKRKKKWTRHPKGREHNKK